ncbi:hypothetical protein AYO08_10340 [Pseudomonas putida]|uniref:hypothetical protein n=1 Tax=Pseudomonas TaxID=286 RepID=UPI0007DC23CE|nr:MULTISPECIES: hypothetical protein [Pseudomonas]OAS07722.1 hypothetical protein AYO08_10340 [Pseudomonas putida]OOV92662.1 hypothetical protein MF6396_25375 [Pseudomonas sp. MF6396]
MLQIPKALLEKRITKETLHRSGKRLLKEIAGRLKLPETSYEIRSCKGGNAVMGEVILHSDHLYLMVHLGSGGVLKVLYRSCEGRKDYSGGLNCYVSVLELASTTAAERFISKLDTLNELGKRQHGHQAA